MERLLTWLALAFGGVVALLLPGLVLVTGMTSLRMVLNTEAEINGRLVTELVSSNPELWKVETLRLAELLRQRPGDKVPERRRVIGLDSELVYESDDGIGNSVTEARVPVYDAGQLAGWLVIQRSLQPLAWQITAMAAAGLLLGMSVYLILKRLPMAELKRAHERLRHEATHDALTGLPNRSLFLDRLEQAMSRAQRSGRPMALLFIDLDRFKDVNDRLGHQMGDEVLRRVAVLLEASLREGTTLGRRANDGAYTIARLGGDEFTVIVESAGDTQHTLQLGQRLLQRLGEPQTLAGRHVYIGGSIGVALYPQDNADRDGLLQQADMAMYRAKELGRNNVHFFNEELNKSIQQRIGLEQDLRGALERGEYQVYYQPKANLRTGRTTGVEALLRWHRPGEGLVAPDRFIGLLEDSRLILPVGAWVLRTACEQLVAWDALGLPPLTMAVNLSARQFKSPELVAQLAEVLRNTGIAPQRLELELTESLLMEDNELSRGILLEFAKLGVRVAIDDFGTGHSSLSYLKRFRVDTLKVDKSFVRDLPHDRDNCAIASAVVALAHSMKLDVVCEGIERPEQLAFMRSLDCDAFQGFLLARPMPADRATGWLRQHVAGDTAMTGRAAGEPDEPAPLHLSLPLTHA